MPRTSIQSSRILAALLALGLFMASSAGAANWRITLENGNILKSRYKPVDASFDDSMIMFLSVRGNWVAISKSIVADIAGITDELGYGTILDSVTVLIGQLPNDKPSAEEEAELDADAAAILQGRVPNYSMPLFSEPGQTGGIPLSFLSQTTPPMGGGAAAGGSSFANQRRSGGGPAVYEPMTRDF